MKWMGLVTDKENKNLSASDRLLIKPLKKYGYIAEAAVWDDKKTDWRKFDILVFRSCWNYYKKYQKWLEWLDGLEAKNIRVWNPIEIIKWNSHKSYLLELEKKGVKIIPTKIIQAGNKAEGQDLLVKPAVGASGFQVKKVNKFKAKTDYLVQPYLDEAKQAEIRLVFINRQYSHAVIRRVELVNLPESVISQAKEVIDLIPSPLLYARVDGMMMDNQFTLMELELIEPQLFLDLYPTAAETLARAVYELN